MATITRTTVIRNTVSVASTSGVAYAVGGAMTAGSPADEPVTINNSVVTQNTVTASAPSGTAFAQGGAISNSGTLSATRTIVSGNTATAVSPGAIARGGGIYNSTFLDIDLPIALTLTDVVVTGNRVDAGIGGTAEGGGLYTTVPLTRTRSPIRRNTPDQCTGCD